jgi:dolichol-phosphate mannosyltransferase
MNRIVKIKEKIGVVIPCYKVKNQILDVLRNIPDIVDYIYVVDDACPEMTGRHVEENVTDSRIQVILHDKNKGVGAAVMSGYLAAIKQGVEVIVKIDGDGQMDPQLISKFIYPIILGEADYTKGNRFYNLDEIRQMPLMRLIGNGILSFLTKFSTGYWGLFDPTNGYTAIHAKTASILPFKRISNRYFFESDMLFHLNTIRAVVVDVPMDAKYEDEVSNLKISKILGEFLYKHLRNFVKRIFYSYYLRDFSIASIELPLGLLMTSFGVIYGILSWSESLKLGIETSAGTVMLSALPILIGTQLILAFLNHDISTVPNRALHKSLGEYKCIK